MPRKTLLRAWTCPHCKYAGNIDDFAKTQFPKCRRCGLPVPWWDALGEHRFKFALGQLERMERGEDGCVSLDFVAVALAQVGLAAGVIGVVALAAGNGDAEGAFKLCAVCVAVALTVYLMGGKHGREES